MDEEIEVSRSIRMPKRVWDALDGDAGRCKRSSTKQVEAILSEYYELEAVGLRSDLDPVRKKISPGLQLGGGQPDLPVLDHSLTQAKAFSKGDQHLVPPRSKKARILEGDGQRARRKARENLKAKRGRQEPPLDGKS